MFLEARSAQLIGGALANVGPLFDPTTETGDAPVLVYRARYPGSDLHSDQSFWLLADTGRLYPDPSERAFGLSPIELLAAMERGEVRLLDADVLERVNSLAYEQQGAIDADPDFPKKIGITQGEGALLRAEPDHDSKVVASIPEGALVVVYEFAGSWARVRTSETALPDELAAADPV